MSQTGNPSPSTGTTCSGCGLVAATVGSGVAMAAVTGVDVGASTAGTIRTDILVGIGVGTLMGCAVGKGGIGVGIAATVPGGVGARVGSGCAVGAMDGTGVVATGPGLAWTSAIVSSAVSPTPRTSV